VKQITRATALGLIAVLVCMFASTQLACVSRRIQEADLPEAPIAFLHWEDKAARKRSEAFGAAGELPPMPPDKYDPEGAEERQIRAYLQAEHSVMLAGKLAKHPGRLMLYWPRADLLERVHAAPPNSRPLAWSRDHQRLLFVSSHRDGKEQLYEYDLQAKHLSVLTFGPSEHARGDYDAQGRLAILRIERSSRPGRSRQTVVLASPGGRIEGEVARDVHPGTLRLSPAGDRIVYEQVRARPRRDGATTFDSFVATRTFERGAQEQILTRGREPSMTPDGEWIVFASPSSAGYRLRRMRPDGTSRVPIRPGGTEERMPTVSPEGGFIAFIRDGGDSRRLYVRRFDGKSERALVASGWSEFPVW
jgi:Tol biopolymer transport system component